MSCCLCGGLFNLKASIHNGQLYCPNCLNWHYWYNPDKEWFEIKDAIRNLPKHRTFK